MHEGVARDLQMTTPAASPGQSGGVGLGQENGSEAQIGAVYSGRESLESKPRPTSPRSFHPVDGDEAPHPSCVFLEPSCSEPSFKALREQGYAAPADGQSVVTWPVRSCTR